MGETKILKRALPLMLRSSRIARIFNPLTRAKQEDLPRKVRNDKRREKKKKKNERMSSDRRRTSQSRLPVVSSHYDVFPQHHVPYAQPRSRRSKTSEWAKKYQAGNRNPLDENASYIQFLSKALDIPLTSEVSSFPEVNAIRLFMMPEPTKSPSKQILRIEHFCLGAQTGLDTFIPPPGQTSELQDAQTPKIWVEDRNWDTNDVREHKKDLSSADLQKVLEEEVSICYI